MAQHRIVVVGAGVIGLTTALLLSQKDGYSITIAAKHMPGDYDIEYASPWAGANYAPLMTVAGERANLWEKNTWPILENLARFHPEAGVHFQQLKLFVREKDVGTAKASRFIEALDNHPWLPRREVPKHELPAGIVQGIEATSVCINTAIYLPYLVSQCLKNGVVLKRAVFSHVSDAAARGVHHSGETADLVVNCTGLSSRKLGGVADQRMVPVRGQVVVVRNDPGAMYSITGTDDESDEASYIMTRAAGGGTILGGCMQEGSWDSQPDPNLAVRIMKRAVSLCPNLTGGKGIEHLSVIRHGVGLRPMRIGGARLEREMVRGVRTVHLYGHAGAGYQSSYGSCQEALEEVEKLLRDRARL